MQTDLWQWYILFDAFIFFINPLEYILSVQALIFLLYLFAAISSQQSLKNLIILCIYEHTFS